jgi:uncharacterized protein
MGEWDPDKAGANLRKHGISFDDGSAALDDPHVLERRVDRGTEERSLAIGFDRLGRLLAVVYTWRDGGQRIISARRASRRERRTYEAERK